MRSRADHSSYDNNLTEDLVITKPDTYNATAAETGPSTAWSMLGAVLVGP